jgi:hypothetical protein
MNDFDPAHKAVFQAHLDPMGMARRFSQQIPDNTLGEFTAPLVLFQYNGNVLAGLDIGPSGSVTHFQHSSAC